MSSPTTTSPGAFARALQEQRRRRARRKLAGLVTGALVLVLGALGIYLFFFSDVFAVDEVAVSGTSLLTEDDVRTAAAVPTGEPLAGIDVPAISARVADLVQVADVEVDRRLPGTVEIAVTERALVYQRADDDAYQWVDRTGTIFHRATEPQAGVIVVESASDDQRLLTDVATVVRHLPEPVAARVVQVEARGVDEIVLLLDGDDTVVWGSAEQSELKAEVLTVLLSVEAEVYDVSAPAHPTTK